MAKVLGSIILALGFAASAHAALSPPPAAAPEIDPASALGALTLLGATLAVFRGRRLKKK